ncbi:MAG: hypothetical protein IJ366_03600 [Clostridia bacterium]|nr:hypothetical protein [Clostridia bacterium]
MDLKNAFLEYFGKGATAEKRIGLELEHFVMRNNRPLGYSEGTGNILSELSEGAEKTFTENGYILGSDMGDYTLTLEPGAQLEISVSPMCDTEKIAEVLNSFYRKAEPVLEKYGARLETVPTLSRELLESVELIPKKRYEYMDKYFQMSGTMGRHMMRGSASVQVSVDYEDEADFVCKFRTAYILTPIFAFLISSDKKFDRITIWDNTDNKRTYIPEDLFADSFGFESYAEALMLVPAIFIPENGEYIYTDGKSIGELSERLDVTEELVGHFLSMVFPDVRLKQYIEIRIADAVESEKAVAYAELVKTLFYTDALSEIATEYSDVTVEGILAAKSSLVQNGSNAVIYGKSANSQARYILNLAKKYGNYNKIKALTGEF